MNLGERVRRRSRTAALLSGLLVPGVLAACGGGAGGHGGAAGGPGGPGGGAGGGAGPGGGGGGGQRAAVRSQEAPRTQKRAALEYAHTQVRRMETLYKGGAASKQPLDEAQTALAQAQADYDALGAQVQEQRVQLGYYRVTAPTVGVVGDVPVRAGDRVTTSTLLTTIDQNDALEVYISVPIAHAKDPRLGPPVGVLGGDGALVVTTQLYFISPLVDDQTQEVLVKA